MIYLIIYLIGYIEAVRCIHKDNVNCGSPAIPFKIAILIALLSWILVIFYYYVTFESKWFDEINRKFEGRDRD